VALGFIKNILGKHKKKLGTPRTGMLEPTGNIRLEITVPIYVSQQEIDQFGFSGSEQMTNNPRIRDKLRRCI
jgi:hypothetical protein